MMTDKTFLTYFSATHTSRNVGRAVAEGCCKTQTIQETDVTFQALKPTLLKPHDLLIVSVPVYGGHVAPLALKRLEALQGEQTPAVAIVVYGNRNFESAASELQDFLTKRGFNVIAAAAFVGEHSYSTQEHPIAPHRPNHEDLEVAHTFGTAICNKLEETGQPNTIDASQLVCPDSGAENLLGFKTFIQEYQAKAAAQAKAQTPPVKLVPQVDELLCTSCGSCANVCPTGAIDENRPVYTDPEKCIKCCACVKNCPEGARSLATPFGPVLARFFSQNKPNVYVL